MNGSQSRILTTLRDGGTLGRETRFGRTWLKRSDGSVVGSVRGGTLAQMVYAAWLERVDVDIDAGKWSYRMTDRGLSVARSIRNKVTP